MPQIRHRIIRFSVDHPRLIVIAAILITIALIIPIPNAVIDTDPENMLASGEPVRAVHKEIKEEFSLSDFLVVGFVGQTDLTAPDFIERLGLLVAAVEEMESVVTEDIWAPSTVDDIYRTPDGTLVIGPLTGPRTGWEDNQPSVAAKIAGNPILRGKIASGDGRAVALYIPLESKTYAHDVSEQVKAEMAAIGGFGEYHIAGLPVAEETFGTEMFRQMAISAPLAGILIFLLMLIFFRRFSVVASPMIVAVMTVIWTMGLLVLLKFPLHIMSSMIPIFLMPIAVLDSIHILSEFHDRYQQSSSRRAAITSTLEELFAPMLFTSITTFVGFISLVSAPIPPVRVFGVFVATGVAVAWVLSMTFNPAYAMLLPERVLARFGRLDEGRSFLGRLLPRAGRFAAKARIPILVVSVLALAFATVGISKIVINDNPTKWFKPAHPIRVAEEKLGEHLAGTYEAYLLFDATGTADETVKDPAVLTYMEGLQRHLEQMPQVGATTGVTDIVKKVRFELKDGDPAANSIPNNAEEIAQELFLYEAAGGDSEDLYKFITPDGGKAVLWLQLREGDNLAVAEVVQATERYTRTVPPPAGLTFAWGGLTYVNIVWQDKMVSGMRNALLGSFAVVLIMMIILLRSVILGLISMVPLSVTIAMVYGLVGWTGKSYDMPIAVLSSLTLGLSIDFAIHFLKRGQEIYARRGSLAATLEELFEEPARAIARNIVVIALGFVPLLFSSLVPYITVGVFFLLIMGLSGVATLFILPALLHVRGARALQRWGAVRVRDDGTIDEMAVLAQSGKETVA
ncbi:MAG TPA: MMPL family transporter [Acidobacteriota bacterium]|nr:MMPL family transporter [Acidobacteriota bacterium]